MPDQLVNLDDAEEFSQMFEDSHLLIYRYIFGMLGGPKEDVEDITSETYFRAWRGRTRFKGSSTSATSWLLRIAKNVVIDNARKSKRRGHVQVLDPEHHAEPQDQREIETSFIVNEDVRKTWELIQCLSEKQKEIMVMRYFLDLPVKLIAEHMGMVENTVSVNIRRILNRLREQWK